MEKHKTVIYDDHMYWFSDTQTIFWQRIKSQGFSDDSELYRMNP
jgi:hypothetical protein